MADRSDPDWTTINHAAELVSRSSRTVWRLIRTYEIPTASRGGFTTVQVILLRRAVAKAEENRLRASMASRKHRDT